jgi:hypothetical protein
MNVPVIDIGGTNVKILATGQQEPIKFPSGPTMTAKAMVILKPIALHLCFQLQQRMRKTQPSKSCPSAPHGRWRAHMFVMQFVATV